MTNKRFLLQSLVLLGAITMYVVACHKHIPCKSLVQDSFFTFTLVDRNGISQMDVWGATYLLDSTYVVKPDGSPANQLERLGNSITFFIPEKFTEAIDSQVTRTFFLYLPDIHGNPRADTDTITFRYRFQTGEEVCFEHMEVIFNDSLYYNGNYTTSLTFTKY